ncbi:MULTISPECIES: hypothetical protein [unclassified Oceanispirochaeta]|uniref:hypothetical protein n=1 Tax=unclassified Oceanispirochaeta TaxID=2635722 RepID=UPI001314FCD8|nr:MULTISPECIES: hypothetical protein [unclassified Oceanispirochaeta]MBF9014395.1 hypothetical protein [Oceanispirochaeta sp. M2]NPD71281.1 hypothetical protein [Oceanispirochaeta sp. M1]
MAKVINKNNIKERSKKVSDFTLTDKVLITTTSIVAFGGFLFCSIMIVLMNSIEY